MAERQTEEKEEAITAVRAAIADATDPQRIKTAIARAKKLKCNPAELAAAENSLSRIISDLEAEAARTAALTKLRKAATSPTANVDLSVLQRTISNASDADVPEADIERARTRHAQVVEIRREKEAALTLMAAAAAAVFNVQKIKQTIEEAVVVGADAREIERAKQALKRVVDLRAEATRSLEEAQAAATATIDLGLLQVAVDRAVGVGVDGEIVAAARAKQTLVEQARSQADAELVAATAGEPAAIDLDALRRAICTAKSAGDLDGALPALISGCVEAGVKADLVDTATGRVREERVRRAFETLERLLTPPPSALDLEALDAAISEAQAACEAVFRNTDDERRQVRDAAKVLRGETRRREARAALLAAGVDMPTESVDLEALQQCIDEAVAAGVDPEADVEPARALLSEIRGLRATAGERLRALATMRMSALPADDLQCAVEAARWSGVPDEAAEARLAQKRGLEAALVLLLEAHNVCDTVAPPLLAHGVCTTAAFAALTADQLMAKLPALSSREQACALRSAALLDHRLSAYPGRLALTVENYTEDASGSAVYSIRTARLPGPGASERVESTAAYRASEIESEIHALVLPVLKAAGMSTSFPFWCPRWMQFGLIKRSRVYRLERYLQQVVDVMMDDQLPLDAETRSRLDEIRPKVLGLLNLGDLIEQPPAGAVLDAAVSGDRDGLDPPSGTAGGSDAAPQHEALGIQEGGAAEGARSWFWG